MKMRLYHPAEQFSLHMLFSILRWSDPQQIWENKGLQEQLQPEKHDFLAFRMIHNRFYSGF